MLTILSANENLLERLVRFKNFMNKILFYFLQELLVQNTPKADGIPVKAHSVLLNSSNGTANGLPVQAPIRDDGEYCTKWMVLMAKKNFDEHQMTWQALADLFRFSLAMVISQLC